MNRLRTAELVLAMVLSAVFTASVNGDYFLDDFSSSTVADYTYSDSYGSGGSFDISGDTLNIHAASGNTASAMRATTVPFLVGEWLAVDAPGPGASTSGHNVFLVFSTTAGQPNGSSSYGIRLARENATLRTKIYPGGNQPTVAEADVTTPATLWINRVSDTVFDSYYELEGSGTLTPVSSDSMPDLAGITDLYIGAQAWAGSQSFDNLRILSSTSGGVASIPVPGTGDPVILSLTELSWTLPQPRQEGDTISCDVWFGTDPDLVGATKIADRITANSTTNFTLGAAQTYYWSVDCYDPDGAGPEIKTEGPIWNFSIITQATDNVPGEGVTVDLSLAQLTWQLPGPRQPGDTITCDVLLGTDPTMTVADKIVDKINVESTSNFSLSSGETYHWRVDCYDPVGGGPEIKTEGAVWSFNTINPMPIVDAGKNRRFILDAGSVTVGLEGSVTDDDPYTVAWSVESGPIGGVSFLPNPNAEEVDAVITLPGEYVLRLTATDQGVPVSIGYGEVSITVYEQQFADPTVRFGIVTDSHYADRDPSSRYYRDSIIKLTDTVNTMNAQTVSFLIEIGDFKDQDGTPVEANTIEYLQIIEAVFQQFDGPLYHVLGNHDMDSISKSQFMAHVDNTGIEPADSTYYSFDVNGIHFIVLDANYNTASDDDHYDHGNFNWTVSYIPTGEMAWLQQDLADADGPVIVFVHQRMDGGGSHLMTNSAEVRSVLERSGKVVAAFQGHHHSGGYTNINGIHYYTLKATVEGPYPANNAYAIVEVRPDVGSLIVTGYENAVTLQFTPTGLEALWEMDDAAGDTAADSSGNSLNGTMSGFSVDDSQWVSGIRRGALDFDGIDDYVVISGYQGVVGTQSRTVSAWIRPTAASGTILSWGNPADGEAWIFMVNAAGQIQVTLNGVDGDIAGSTDLITDGLWHHVAAVLENDGSPDLSEVALYVDGVQEVAVGGTMPVNTGKGIDVHIGAVDATTGSYFQGQMDDVAIFDTAVSADDIERLYTLGGALFMQTCGGVLVNDAFKLAADTNGDCRIDLSDYSIVVGDWLDSGILAGDILKDNEVNPGDLNLLSNDWLQEIDLSLVAHWKMDENNRSTAADISINRYHGMLYDGPVWQSAGGRLEGALQFDGVDDYVQITDFKGLLGGQSRTVCMWVSMNTPAQIIVAWGPLGASGRRWVFGTNTAGQLWLGIGGGGSITGTADICDGAWHHVAVVAEDDGSPNINEVKLYVDGLPDVLSLNTSDVAINTLAGPDVTIGQYNGGSFLEGMIDDVRIYDRALAVDEIDNMVFPEPKAPQEPFSFVQLCDPQLGFGLESYEVDMNNFRQAVVQVNELNPDFVVVCGDLVNTANAQSFADYNSIIDDLNMPCYSVPGNHDIGNTPTLQSLQFFRDNIGEPHFAFEHKGTSFIIVNTQLWKEPLAGESEIHDAWFEGRLHAASHVSHQTFVVGHSPIFLSTPDEADQYYNIPIAKRTEVLGLLDQYDVVAMLGGHRHELLINDYNGTQFVNAETTSQNFDGRPFGFRLWNVDGGTPTHQFVALQEYYDPSKDAHWPLDESEGSTANDASGNDWSGIVNGNPVWYPSGGQVAGALEFDGSDDYVEIIGHKGTGGAHSRTVCAWIRTDTPERVIIAWGPLGASGCRWVFGTNAVGQLWLGIGGGGSITGTADVCDGVWHHVAMVAENDGSPNINEVRLYVDGLPDVPSVNASNVAIDTLAGPDVTIGQYNGAGFFEGTIDEVRIYDRALDGDEIDNVAFPEI